MSASTASSPQKMALPTKPSSVEGTASTTEWKKFIGGVPCPSSGDSVNRRPVIDGAHGGHAVLEMGDADGRPGGKVTKLAATFDYDVAQLGGETALAHRSQGAQRLAHLPDAHHGPRRSRLRVAQD